VYDLKKLNPGYLIDRSKKLFENINIYRKNPNRDLFEESDKEEDETVRKRDLKLNLKYWKTHYLYPFSLKVGNTIDEPIEPVDEENFIAKFIGSKSLKFPYNKIQDDHQYLLKEISKPISITQDDIKGDLARIYRNFPINYFPHVDENNRIIDNIHNFK
jgi:hypothetical protein